jgi:cell fate (sporulation/competence/biofilm development) regulator YlbF (YheA/YmcA/DUF963 family)
MASSRKRRLKIKKGETHKSIEIKYCKPEISIQHTREYSKIFVEWEDKNEKSEDLRREGKYHIVSYTYRNEKELDDNIQKISDLKNIFPYLSIKSSLIKYLKTLRPLSYV